MPSKSHDDKEWPISLTRARAGNEDDILAVALEALDHYDNNPVDDSEFLADKTKRYLQEIWSQWLRLVHFVASSMNCHPNCRQVRRADQRAPRRHVARSLYRIRRCQSPLSGLS